MVQYKEEHFVICMVETFRVVSSNPKKLQGSSDDLKGRTKYIEFNNEDEKHIFQANAIYQN